MILSTKYLRAFALIVLSFFSFLSFAQDETEIKPTFKTESRIASVMGSMGKSGIVTTLKTEYLGASMQIDAKTHTQLDGSDKILYVLISIKGEQFVYVDQEDFKAIIDFIDFISNDIEHKFRSKVEYYYVSPDGLNIRTEADPVPGIRLYIDKYRYPRILHMSSKHMKTIRDFLEKVLDEYGY